MTPEKRQVLRDWSARLMGLTLHFEIMGFEGRKKYYYLDKNKKRVGYWTPDLDSAPASQFLSVIERMKGFGYTLTTISGPDRKPQALFIIIESNWSPNDFVEADTLLLAVLLAAMATGVE